jgi:PAS domain-containing protein
MSFGEAWAMKRRTAKSSSKKRNPRESRRAAKSSVIEVHRVAGSLGTSEERYELVIKAVAEGIYDWNIETNALYVSPQLTEIFNFGEVKLTSKAWWSHVHPDDMGGYRSVA